MSPLKIAAIVEGHGEAEALPVLVRRIAGERAPDNSVVIDPVLRVSASALLREGELERTIELAARRAGPGAAIFILLDWEDGCPKTDAPPLTLRARKARPDREISLVLACREYESWFLIALESLRSSLGIDPEICAPPSVESIRGAKEWLSKSMRDPSGYSPVIHQAKCTAAMDLDVARSSDSFDKCYRELSRLLAQN